MKATWLIAAFVILAVVAVLGGSYLLQIAPTATSIKVYEYAPASPFVQSSADLSLRPRVGFEPSASGATSGISALLWTPYRDPAKKWIVNYELSCDGLPVVNSKGSAIVYGYTGINDQAEVQQSGIPSSTIWITVPMSSRIGNVSSGRSCSILLFLTTGNDPSFEPDELFWVADSTQRSRFGSAAWAEPPQTATTTSPDVPEQPGSVPTIAATESGEGEGAPPPPERLNLTNLLIVAVIVVLIVLGAMLAFLAFVAD